MKVTAFPWICQFHTYLYNKFKSTQIPCCLILRASNCARVLVCPEALETVLISNLGLFFTPSSHILDKGRLGLIFSSDSSSFLFLKNKDKSSQEEMGSAVCSVKVVLWTQLLLALLRAGGLITAGNCMWNSQVCSWLVLVTCPEPEFTGFEWLFLNLVVLSEDLLLCLSTGVDGWQTQTSEQ